jgi:succinate dehydrogenase / fumarate reductase cytochrome b subunit
MAEFESPTDRPLSPHLQIYRLSMTFLMSGFHRATGFALYFGMLIPVAWLLAAATGPDWFEFVNGLLDTILGRLVLFGYTWGLIHHMLGGVRHLIWDTGRGLDLESIELFARLTLIGSVALTAAVWLAAFALGGLQI